jgi:putative transposase
MLKTYKYRLYPTKDQQVLMSKHFGCCRWIYNWALARKIELWKTDNRTIGRYELDATIPILKKSTETKWLSEVNAQSLQHELVNLEIAYKRFFKDNMGFPKFKSKKGRQRFQCPQRVTMNFNDHTISFPKIGSIKSVVDRRFSGNIRTVTVSRDPSGKHYASVLVETGVEIEQTKPFDIDSTVGIDLGLKDFSTLSTGEKIGNPRFFKSSLDKLAREQRRLSRKQKGSSNRKKQRIKVALAYEKIRFQRQDFLHKLSTRIIRENQAVALETLNVKEMVRNRRLSRSISDVGWGEFVRQLEYKAEWYGKTILRIGRFEPSSRLCTCGIINRDLKLSDRVWTCKHCGTTHDRDVLAANNIKQMALSQLGRGTPEVTPVERKRGRATRGSRKLLGSPRI